jgi:hypothetical protein
LLFKRICRSLIARYGIGVDLAAIGNFPPSKNALISSLLPLTSLLFLYHRLLPTPPQQQHRQRRLRQQEQVSTLFTTNITLNITTQ